jgi:hypothetical protein
MLTPIVTNYRTLSSPKQSTDWGREFGIVRRDDARAQNQSQSANPSAIASRERAPLIAARSLARSSEQNALRVSRLHLEPREGQQGEIDPVSQFRPETR